MNSPLWLYNTTWYQDYDHLQCTIWFQTYIPSSECAGSGFKRGCSWITAKQGEGRGGQTNKSFYPWRAFQPPNTFIANNNKTWKNGDLISPRSFQTFNMAMHAMIPPHQNLLKGDGVRGGTRGAVDCCEVGQEAGVAWWPTFNPLSGFPPTTNTSSAVLKTLPTLPSTNTTTLTPGHCKQFGSC